MGFNKRTWNDRFGKEFSNQDSMRRLDAGRVNQVILSETPDYIDTLVVSNTTTNTSDSIASAITDTELTDYIPNDLKKIRGVLIYADTSINVSGTKTKSGTKVTIRANYSLGYNTSPWGYNYICNRMYTHCASDADNVKIDDRYGVSTQIPVTQNGNKFYITWNVIGHFDNMTSVLSSYGAGVFLYILGFYI